MTTPQMDWLDDQRRKRAVSSDDIVERLRQVHQTVPIPSIASLYSDAADEIERLRAAGDAMAAIVGDVVVPFDDESKARTMVTAYDTWREARRG